MYEETDENIFDLEHIMIKVGVSNCTSALILYYVHQEK